MIVIGGVVFGALSGALMARRRGGRRLDMAHHAAALAILFGVVGMMLTIVIARLA